MQKTFVISLGGSLIVPGKIDVNFLKKFSWLIKSQIKTGKRFVLITGGGKVCRDYQNAAKQINPTISATDIDWIGTKSTQLNAVLVSKLFGQKAQIQEHYNPYLKSTSRAKVIVSAGFKPGHSTDFDAIIIAKTHGAKTVINLSNIDFAYTKDPKKFKDAKKITEISWQKFKKIVGDKWVPGLNAPFDPMASKLAQHNKITVIIANGKNLKNLTSILNDKKFKGTVIS